MYFVYILQSVHRRDKFYVGSTGDLSVRLKQHNSGQTISTFRHAPWKIVYYEAYRSVDDARRREKRLKHHGKGMQELKKRITGSINY